MTDDRNPLEGKITGAITAEEARDDRDRRDYTQQQVLEWRRGQARIRRAKGQE